MPKVDNRRAEPNLRPQSQPRSSSPHARHPLGQRSSRGKGNARSWRWRYLGLGIASLIWLLVRTGTAPRRIVYPCQRTAAAGALGLLQYLGSLAASTVIYQRIRGRGIAASAVLLIVVLACAATLRRSTPLPAVPAGGSPELPSWTSPSAVSDVFAVRNVPAPSYSIDEGTVPAGVEPPDALHDTGVDALINLMESREAYLHKTAAHPSGIIGPSDVVVIKINDQWNGQAPRARTHTNNDVLKGLIYRILRHPEGFTGVVIVGENTQWTDPNWDNEDHNNAQDPHQSYRDVVNAFVSQDYDVCISDWRSLSGTFVDEFNAGDTSDGYVLVDDPGEPGTDQLSYPKFSLTCGSQSLRISMRYGLWDGATYDNTHLKMINLPVLKRHGWAGATIAVKNYIGFLTTGDRERRFGDSSEMHGFFWGHRGIHPDYGLLGRQMARIRRADLNIVDAIWVAKASNSGGCPNDCVRQDVLLASTDPIALDYYASVNVLTPLSPSMSLRNILRHLLRRSSPNDANAALHDSKFRNFLLCNENRLRLEGVTDIIDLDDDYTQPQEEAQFNAYVTDARVTGSMGSSRASVGQLPGERFHNLVEGGIDEDK